MALQEQLCGNKSIQAWQDNNFGQCFVDLVFVIGSHSLFAICSAFYLGRHHTNHVRRFEPNTRFYWISICRVIVALSLAILPWTYVITQILCKIHLEIIDYVTSSVVCITWIIHAITLWHLLRLGQPLNKGRGPMLLIMMWLLTVATICVQLRSAILFFEDKSNSNVDNVEQAGVIIAVGGLQLLYLLLLLPTVKSGATHVRVLDSINADISEDEGEGDPLLPYMQTEEHELGIAEDEANILSKLTYWWVQPLMVKGSKGHLKSSEDLFQLPRKIRTDDISVSFMRALQNRASRSLTKLDILLDAKQDETQEDACRYEEVTSKQRLSESDLPQKKRTLSDNENIDVTLLQALHKCFGLKFYSLGLLKLISDCLNLAGPVLLNYLVSYMERPTEATRLGYYYAAGLLLTTFLSAMCSVHFNYLVNKISLQARAALVTSIYHKALSVGSTTLSKFSTGEIVNFMSTDVDRVRNFGVSFHAFWSLPVQVAIAFYLLYQQIQLTFLVGVGVMVLLIPLNYMLAMKIGKLNQDLMKRKDNRVKMISEVLFGIRVIKFFAWERHFTDKINFLRADELKSLRGIKYLDAFCVYFWATTPVLISLLTFATYAATGGQLSAAKVFTCVALFNILVVPLNAFPWVLNGLMEAWVSVNRLQTFMNLQDMDLSKYYHQGPISGNQDTCMAIQSGEFQWKWQQQADCKNLDDSGSQCELLTDNGDDNDSALGIDSTQGDTVQQSGVLALTDINLSIRKGQLIGVIGNVGSGKSSLLAAITGEMKRCDGDIWVECLNEGFGLSTQEAWIQQATVKDNILFGMPYIHHKYNAVLDACALREDLKILPAGDLTEIGENGVTLSGGQKARVALARAVYQDKDIYLLDDPLAAVDAHVAAHLFTQCIMGLLANKTRILCTHHTKYLKAADLVVVMSEGKILNAGPPSIVLDETAPTFIMRDEDDEQDSKARAKSTNFSDEEVDGLTITSQNTSEQDGTLIEEEGKEVGVVKLHVYWSYWKAIGKCLAPAILLSLFFMQASRNTSDWWLSYWVTHSHQTNNASNISHVGFLLGSGQGPVQPTYWFIASQGIYQQIASPASNGKDSDIEFYLTVYGSIAVVNSICTFCRAFLFAYGGICAARILHKRLLSSILKAPVVFFDVTPIGRIINRFSSDMYEIDDTLPFVMNILLAQLYSLFGSIVVTCYGLPWFTILLVPLAIFYYYIQHYYRQTSRELKRLSSVTLSPIYAHFSETLNGLVTIRALRASDRFQSDNNDKLNTSQRAQFSTLAASQWLAIRLQMIGVAIVTGVAFIAVLEHHLQSVNPGLVGLALSYALSITSLLSGVVTMFTETEKEMVSVERTVQYIEDVEPEKNHAIIEAPLSWPRAGCIIFHDIHMAYRPGLPNALNGVSFTTKPGEKIGIVGRTGSGKSSLFRVLFRMQLIQSGSVCIDGIDISHLDLTELRSRLVIIPQDSFLFSGSVRENLDPTQCYTDNELWNVLGRCHLRKVVEKLGGLDADVAERGKHFSVGQKQLVCLARALLTKAKVLCVDEATASVDQETDQFLQQTILEEFASHTVLTIAHRIHTIVGCDRTLVMDKGKVAEFDTPDNLLSDKNTLFYGLVNKNF
ncbi:ATP-binding cassette sub-family C member 10-like [Glandiceps talaboti]